MTFKNKILLFVLSLFARRKLKVTDKDRQRLDFKSSTQKIGVTETDKIRDTFRNRWLKKIYP